MSPTGLSTFNGSQALLIRSWRSFSMTSSTRRKTRGPRTRFFFPVDQVIRQEIVQVARYTQATLTQVLHGRHAVHASQRNFYLYPCKVSFQRSPRLQRFGIMICFKIKKWHQSSHWAFVSHKRKKMALKTNCLLFWFHLFSKASKSLSHQLQ